MADISDIQAALTTKVVGSDATGAEQTPVNSTTGGALYVNLRDATTGNEVTNLPVTVTKVPLTPAAPTVASVGIASATVVAANAGRDGLTLTNNSVNIIYLAFGANPAVVGSGETIYPGGSFVMDLFSFNTLAVNAIASAAASSLAIQEYN